MISSSFKKAFVCFSLFSLISETAYPAVVLAENYFKNKKAIANSGGGTPIADAAGGMVDKYTGDFHYSVPLMNVPGPHGESVDISASYSGGIRMEQKASWLGLGWDYNPGEITRQVIGSADDYCGQPVFAVASTNITNNYTFGPFYFDKINSFSTSKFSYLLGSTYGVKESTDAIAVDNSLDFSNYYALNNSLNPSSSTGIPPRWFSKPTAPYSMPAYDKYYVSGPGIGGSLQPYIFQNTSSQNPRLFTSPISYPTKPKTQFYFENSTAKTLTSVSDDATSNNRVRSGYFIKYYTNAEINTSSNWFSNTNQTGFLDYRIAPTSGNRRPSSDFDPDGIGGIEITNPNGLTYHYSLPVYTKEEMTKNINHNGATSIYLDNTNWTGVVDFTYHYYPYAISWKLTSVTGADYLDANNNKIADEGDQGYWIGYGYSLWNNEHFWSSTPFNYKEGFSPIGNGVFLTNDLATYPNPIFAQSNSIMQGKTQQYYLDYIQTSTHTAYFVKDVRLDEHSAENVINGSSTVNPLLRLSRIVLLRNADKGLINNGVGWSTSSFSSKFSTTLLSSSPSSLVHIYRYVSNKTNIDNASLKQIEFKTDYSLCKKIYNNANNTYVGLTVNGGTGTTNPLYLANNNSNLLYAYYESGKSGCSYSTADANNSGRLTLNEIVSYEDGAQKIFPSYQFDYHKSSSTENPDFDLFKTDMWGYYKSDYTGLGCSHFTTYNSSLNVGAYSLKEILTPLGGKIKVEYESDIYEREGYTDDPYGSWYSKPVLKPNPPAAQNKPYLIYPLYSMSLSNQDDCRFIYNDYAAMESCYGGVINGGSNTEAGRLLVVPVLDNCTGLAAGVSSVYSSNMMTYWTNIASAGSVKYSSGVSPGIDFGGWRHYSQYSGNLTSGGDKFPDLDAGGGICTSNNTSIDIYKKEWGYGYLLMKMSYLYGGGTRVKSITVNDPATSQDFKQTYEYYDGYCPVVPKPFMLGPQTDYTMFMLWHNISNLFPYGPSSTVGYTKVIVKNVNKYNDSNGSVNYSFNNSTMIKPIHSTGAVTATNYFAGICSPFPCIQNGNASLQKVNRQYYITNEFKNDKIKQLGKIDKVEIYDANSVPKLISSTKYNYDFTNFFLERYDHDLNVVRNLPIDRPCTQSGTTGGTPIYPTCTDWEDYHYGMSYWNYSIHLTGVTKMIDGITTNESYTLDKTTADVSEVVTTSPNMGTVRTNKDYACNSYPDIAFKCDNEVRDNQVLIPNNVRKYKQANTWAPGWAYLISEDKTTFQAYLQYRIFNATKGCYDDATLIKQRWYFPIQSDKRLLDDNTPGGTTATPVYRTENKILKYNNNNSPIESLGLNNRVSAVKYGYNNLYPLSNVSNANYNSFTFSSFEDTVTVAPGVLHFGGEVTGTQYQKDIGYTWTYTGTTWASFYVPGPPFIYPHTGDRMAAVPPGSQGPLFSAINFERDRTYQAKVWVHKSSPANAQLVMHLTSPPHGGGTYINITQSKSKNDASNIIVGDWILITVELTTPSNLYYPYGNTNAIYPINQFQYLISTGVPRLEVYVSNPTYSSNPNLAAYFDDLMVHPIDAPISGSVYDKRTGRVTATLDNENLATFYKYDGAGRIISTSKEATGGFGIIKVSEQEYHNSRP